MLFEAMTGQFPYPNRTNDEPGICQMIRDRERSPKSVRELNAAVSAGTASIIEHCLAPKSGYKSAEQLRIDIDRHLANLPLRFAPNPSLSERASKWIKRHPRLTSMTAMVFLGLLTATLATILIGARLNRAATLEATQRSHEFVAQLNLASQPLMLGAREAIDLHKQNLELSELLARRTEDAGTYESNLSRLATVDRKQENSAVVDAKYWLARSLFTEALNAGSESERQRLLQKAHEEIESAKLAQDLTPTAFIQLQADLFETQGEIEKAKRMRMSLDLRPADEAEDLPNQLLQAAEYRRKNQELKSLEVLKQLAVDHANELPVWLMMGHSYLNLGQLANAEACYTVCIGLDNRSQWGYFSRGVARLESREFAAAKSDFDSAIALDDSVSATYLNRALAWQGMNELAEAADDVTKAIDLGCVETRAIFIRHQLFKQLGRQELAQADLDKFLQLEPRDEKSWLSRGMAQIQMGKPEQALSDFESALKLNPRSTSAFQNIATVQAEFLGQTQAAIDALTAIIDEQPTNEVAIATRGVLYARNENREQALADAKLSFKTRPFGGYHVSRRRNFCIALESE